MNSEINVTPLVDVMLVLLVIFMITAPMLNAAVDLDLPEASAAVIDENEGKLTLRIDKHKRLFIGDTPVKWANLEEMLTTNRRVQVERELNVEADRNLPYGVVVRAMAIAKTAGATKLNLVTDPNEIRAPIETLDEEAAAAPAPAP